MLSGIILINRNGLRWCEAPTENGPHKTLYTRSKRWSDKDIFARMIADLAADHSKETVMIEATLLKDQRTATSLGVKKGARALEWPDAGRHEHETARYLARPGTPA